MAGNKEGAAKARAKILAKNPNFYKEIGSKSWDNPNRSHETGFAVLAQKDKEKHREISKKGGQKTKEDYRQKETPATTEAEEVSSSEG